MGRSYDWTLPADALAVLCRAVLCCAHCVCYACCAVLQGKPLWNRYINSRIRRVEFNPSLTNLAANWNVCTGLWLRHCEWGC